VQHPEIEVVAAPRNQLDDADRSDVTGDRNPRTSSWIAGIYTRAVINRAFVETPQVLAAFRNADLVSFEVDPFPELEGAEFMWVTFCVSGG